MSRFIEIKGRVCNVLAEDRDWIEDLIESLTIEYPFCLSNVKVVDGGSCWQVTVIHKRREPLRRETISGIRGHIQGWMHAVVGSNGH